MIETAAVAATDPDVYAALCQEEERERGGKRGAPADDNDADDLLGGRRAFKKKY